VSAVNGYGSSIVSSTARALLALAFAGGALAALAQVADGRGTAVTYFPKDEVQAAFAKGKPLVETPTYKVHASRREAAGMAEVHLRDTDVIHVLSGSATFVTGGTVVEPKTVAPDEVRGTAVQGGETRRIGEGDVVIVPSGVPHWFQHVPGPMTYYVVKVPGSAAGSPRGAGRGLAPRSEGSARAGGRR
jgi:mannose-6-phosphate isomerase-like protein (cupin superfamily)